MYRMMALPLHPDFIYKWTKSYELQEEALKYGKIVTDKVIISLYNANQHKTQFINMNL